MAVFRPHCPGFVNGGEAQEGPAEFEGLGDLCSIPQVCRFLSSGASLSVWRQEHYDDFLIGTKADGTYWVIGYVSRGSLQSLPNWTAPRPIPASDSSVRWKKPSEELPECDCGDRVVGVVRYSVPYNDGFGDLMSGGPVQPHIVVLVATEDGFRDVEDGGFDIHDCELWMLESDLIKKASE